MADFDITSPDGQTFRVTAPEGATEAEIMAYAQANMPKAPPVQPSAESKAYRGKILPFSADETGESKLDFSAGVPGMIGDIAKGAWEAATLPGDVYTGKVSPDSPEGIPRRFGLAALISPLNPAVRGGGPIVPTRPNDPIVPPVPSAATLKSTADAQIKAVRNMDVLYKPDAVARTMGELQVALEKKGFRNAQSPKTFAELSRLQAPPAGSVMQFADLHSARRAFQNAAKDSAEAAAASKAIDKIDEFIAAANPGTVISGDARAAAKMFEDFRGNYAGYKRSADLTGRKTKAELRADATASGQNIGNTVRQRLADILTQVKAGRGYNAEDKALIAQAVKGDFGTNAARYMGNLLGGGGGLGQALTASGGALAGNMVNDSPYGPAVGGALAMALGAGLRSRANSGTLAAVGKIDEATRSRTPLAAAAAPNGMALTYQPGGASRTGAPTKTAALAKLLAQMQSEEAATEADFIRKGGI